MKKLFLALAILAIAVSANAAPFLTSDPQDGVEEHLFMCGDYSVVIPANPDGSVWWDFASWTGGFGWIDCTVQARVKYAVEDVATGIMTEAIMDSEPADVRIKIPKAGSNAGYKVQE